MEPEHSSEEYEQMIKNAYGEAGLWKNRAETAEGNELLVRRMLDEYMLAEIKELRAAQPDNA